VRYILRVWLPDKPGALGRVASAIGSVGASLVAIDILEQEAGWAIDEFAVEAVDSPNAEEKLVAALQFIDGVQIESIIPNPEGVVDPRVSALETAVELVEQQTAEGLVKLLVERAIGDLSADWAVVLPIDGEDALAVSGDAPRVAWIVAFLAGSRTMHDLASSMPGPEDIAWTDLTTSQTSLVLGRDGRPFRVRERQQLQALARIADRRLSEFRR
jgi:hypothetical protein